MNFFLLRKSPFRISEKRFVKLQNIRLIGQSIKIFNVLKCILKSFYKLGWVKTDIN